MSKSPLKTVSLVFVYRRDGLKVLEKFPGSFRVLTGALFRHSRERFV